MTTLTMEFEQSLLGALMLDPDCADRIDVPLLAGHFAYEAHRLVFGAIQRLQAAGKPHDVLSVSEELGGDLERAGGLAYLVDLHGNTTSTVAVRRHAQAIVEQAMRRSLQAAAEEIAGVAADPSKTAREAMDLAQARLMAIGDSAAERFEPTVLRDVMLCAMERLQARVEGRVLPGLQTGFPDLDARLGGGLRPGNLAILAARPAMGKTSLALQIAHHVASHGGVALFLSQEMSRDELTDRLLSMEARVELGAIISGRMTQEQWGLVGTAIERTMDQGLWLDEEPALTLLAVRSKARKVARVRGRLDLIVVDYLQLMTGEGANRNAEIEQISRGLKQLAKEMGVPIVALSQLSRQCEQRPNKRPMASDLRDSGAIEQDADVILTLYRDEVYNPDSPHKGLAELGMPKCRSGQSGGFVPLVFNGQFTRFESMFGAWPDAAPAREAKPAKRGFDEF